jgi:hypothetical protein
MGEPPVGRPPVTFQHPGVVLAENLRGVGVAPPGSDPVDHDPGANERPQPRTAPGDPPPGLLGRDDRTLAHALLQRPIGRLEVGSHARPARASAWWTPPALNPSPSWPNSRLTLPAGNPNPLDSHATSATARGPTPTPAAPNASEVCSGCREPRTRRRHRWQRPNATSNRVIPVTAGGRSSWDWHATRSTTTGPPQSGHTLGAGTAITRSTRSGTGRRALTPYPGPGLRPGRRGRNTGRPFVNGAACRLAARRASSNCARNRPTIEVNRATSPASRSRSVHSQAFSASSRWTPAGSVRHAPSASTPILANLSYPTSGR